MRQIPPWMKAAQDKDPEFCNIVSALMDKANSPGALDAKTKTLITMAIDAAIGQRDGVKSLAARARSQGASEAEIAAAVIKEIVGRGAGTRGASFILQTGAENLSWGPPAWMYEARAPRRVQEGDLVMAEVFQVYGGLETQEQMCVSLRPVHAVNQECAAVARRAYEVGLRELRPGKRFLEVAEAMEVPIAEAGCWHLTPLIHSINPLVWIGPTNVGIQQLPGIENYRGITRPYYPTDDFTIKSGMVFELEPNACIGQHRVNIGGTVIVTEDGVERCFTSARRSRSTFLRPARAPMAQPYPLCARSYLYR